ncbi:hypothetical protein MLD52_12935 [Puniceicoccaceae bacterium K14]|nr:hypothetical protein [Puniceicoccaceae bacterium K14]
MKYKIVAAFNYIVFVIFIQTSNIPYEITGRIERYDPGLDQFLGPKAEIEKLADGFDWSEGPVWDSKNNRLLFTDVPQNTAYSWDETIGIAIFLKPSGHPEVKGEARRERMA